jgi:protein-disulfide isomerase
MFTTRRMLMSLAAAGTTAAGLAWSRPTWAADETHAERTIGKPDAKTVVGEYFSLTCTHCAAFARESMPQIHSELIDTGKIRWVFHDYPLDQVALTAAMVARYLPVDRYEPFIDALFQTQDRWAFNRGTNPTDELWKMAALAGMSRSTFDEAIGDASLKSWILAQQQEDQNRWKIDSTPSFVIDGQKYAGEMSFDVFRKLIPDS